MSAISDAFAAVVASRRDDEALWSRGEGLRLSFAEVEERVAAWREWLASARGPVAVATGNRAAFVEVFLALRGLDRVAVAMDGGLATAEKIALCRGLGIPTLLDAAGDDGVRGARDLRIEEGVFRGVRRHELDVEPAATPEGTALVKLTSGSTGVPSGVAFDEPSLLAGIRQITAGMEITAADRVLVAIPLSHSYGFDNGVLSFAVVGTPLVLEPAIYPGPLLRAAVESGATFLPLVPPLARVLGESRWPTGHRLRRVICAGGVLPPATARRFHAASGLSVHDFYGSTETGGIAFERHPEAEAAAGTVGHPLPGVEIELGADGRVLVRSAANRTGLLGDASPVREPVATGDTAEWTAEGRLRLVGRSADILNVGGRKVPAVRVEEALERLPAVLAAAVVGVDDAVRGERTVAFLVAERWPVDLRELPASLMPREVRRLERLPFTERGKLDRGRLRELARSAES